ncbi:hypothetical protein Droror1_Dr00012367 [Drosera rotundifolia]
MLLRSRLIPDFAQVTRSVVEENYADPDPNPFHSGDDPRSKGTASPAETVRSSDPAATTVQDPCSDDSASPDAAIRCSSPTSGNNQDPSSNGNGSGYVSPSPITSSGDALLSPDEPRKEKKSFKLFGQTIWVDMPENDSVSTADKNSNGSQQVCSSPENDSDNTTEKNYDDNQQVHSSTEADELGSWEVIPMYHVMKHEMQLFLKVPQEMNIDMEPSAP